MKQNQSIRRKMVNNRDVVPCRNRVCMCVGQKICLNRNSFHMNLITESSTKLFCPSVLSSKTALCKFIVLHKKYRPGILVLVLQANCITYRVKKTMRGII